MFERPIVSGRGFHGGDSTPGARTVIANEAFARRFNNGASPVGLRVRYAAADPAKPEPWLEIVGVVRDIGTTPTDLGEAPYVYHPATAATASPLMMGVRLAGDPSAFAPRVREIAAALDPGIRLETVQALDDVVWSYDAANLAASGAISGVVALGLFLSAAGIFALMSVSVARRTREIGLRCALGAGADRWPPWVRRTGAACAAHQSGRGVEGGLTVTRAGSVVNVCTPRQRRCRWWRTSRETGCRSCRCRCCGCSAPWSPSSPDAQRGARGC
jgi:hypothetical protein